MINLDLNAQHPDYVIFEPWWIEMRDAIDGQSKIVEKDTDYLAMPGAMALISDPEKKALAYQAFQQRASYPEITAPTIRGMIGIIHSTEMKIELPPSLEYLREKATVDGLTLEGFTRRVTRSILSYGRCGIALTIENKTPYFVVYPALSVLNWDEAETLVVLDETGPEMQDNLSWVTDVQRRQVIQKDENGKVTATAYTQSIGEKSTGGIWAADEEVPYVATGGDGIDFLPFVFVDTNDLTPEPDEVPLLPLVRLAAKAYRQDANYQHTLYCTSSPQYWINDLDPDDEHVPKGVGGGIIWVFPGKSQCGLLEFTGKGADAQRLALKDTFEAAIQAGARLFASADEQQESGTARKIKYAAQTATLTGIAKTVASAIEKALRMAALLVKAIPEQVIVTADTEFIDSTLGAQEMTAIISAVTGGILSEQTGYEQLQKGGRASDERDWDEEKELIEAQTPALGMEGREGGTEEDIIPEEE